MARSFRFAAVAAVLALTSGGLAACGSSGSSSAQDLLRDTFGGGHTVKSGNLALDLDFAAQGLKSLKGPVSIKLDGPFQSQGKGQLPAFDLSLALDTKGSSFSAGAVSTGGKGWLKLQGNTFSIPDALFAQFKSSYEKSGGKSKSGGVSFKSLGIDPLAWLKDPKIVGTESVAGAQTTHVTAGVDVARFLTDLSKLLSKASALSGSTGASLPKSLTEQQRKDIAASVKSASLDVWTGRDDRTLRRLSLHIAIVVPPAVQPRAGGMKSGLLAFDLTIADLNKPQTIAAPRHARPLSDLQRLLAAAQGGSGSSSSGSGSSGSATPAPTGGASGTTSKYLACLQQAGNDVAKLQQCASLVGQ